MKLQAVFVGLLLPVLFSTTNSPSHTYSLDSRNINNRKEVKMVHPGITVVSCLDPHGSLPVNHTAIKLSSDLLL